MYVVMCGTKSYTGYVSNFATYRSHCRCNLQSDHSSLFDSEAPSATKTEGNEQQKVFYLSAS
jgi:hypothetical protein